MPIRTQRGRASAYRSVWQWPLRSPARLALTVLVVAGIAVGATVIGEALAGPPPPGTGGTAAGATTTRSAARTPAASTPAIPTPTALPPVADLEPTALPLSAAPPEALDVAAAWTAAWVRPAEGTPAAQWLAGLVPLTTEEYLGLLAGVDPANIPATRTTGPPEPIAVAPRSVQVEVPTDGPAVLVLVVDTGAGWRVSDHDRA